MASFVQVEKKTTCHEDVVPQSVTIAATEIFYERHGSCHVAEEVLQIITKQTLA